MIISKTDYDEIFVWIWLPGETKPVVAGKLTKIIDEAILDGDVSYPGSDSGRGKIVTMFTYGQSYMNRSKAIPIYDHELPFDLGPNEDMWGNGVLPGCIRDASPDAWGRRVILNNLLGAKREDADQILFDEFTYLMESGSDRIGGLDFQESATKYKPRLAGQASLAELLKAAELIEQGIPLTPELAQAIQYRASIGGARPKVQINDEHVKYIAKFSSISDQYNVIKAEYIAMRLARLCGLNVASVKLTKAAGKDFLLIERFDREFKNEGWTRRLMLSALTLLELDEMPLDYSSYEDLAEHIRHFFTNPKATLREMFGRIVFNILCGNTDDHALNHAAFWDGTYLELTPAYDLCPQMRQGGEASQAMMISGNDRSSRLVTCLSGARSFMLSETEAREIIDAQVAVINRNWDVVCNEADLSPIDRSLFKHRMFLNEYAFEGYNG